MHSFFDRRLQMLLVLLLPLCACTHLANKAFSNEKARPDETAGFENFKKLKMVYEVNYTDQDAEVVIAIKTGEGITSLQVWNPLGKLVISLDTSNLEGLGLAEVEIESAEPDIKSVKKGFIAGTYTVYSKAVSGKTYHGKVDLSYDLPEAPTFSPCNVSNVDPQNLVVSWPAIQGASAYELEIENEAIGMEIKMELGPEITQVSLPPEMIRPDSEYEIGLAVENEAGNIIVSECVFKTGKI